MVSQEQEAKYDYRFRILNTYYDDSQISYEINEGWELVRAIEIRDVGENIVLQPASIVPSPLLLVLRREKSNDEI